MTLIDPAAANAPDHTAAELLILAYAAAETCGGAVACHDLNLAYEAALREVSQDRAAQLKALVAEDD